MWIYWCYAHFASSNQVRVTSLTCLQPPDCFVSSLHLEGVQGRTPFHRLRQRCTILCLKRGTAIKSYILSPILWRESSPFFLSLSIVPSSSPLHNIISSIGCNNVLQLYKLLSRNKATFSRRSTQYY